MGEENKGSLVQNGGRFSLAATRQSAGCCEETGERSHRTTCRATAVELLFLRCVSFINKQITLLDEVDYDDVDHGLLRARKRTIG